ncbi:MAG TPA: NosD domain-containing protein, partial [bacterium]|nr:NosD domain-containing protein [bacterium]
AIAEDPQLNKQGYDIFLTWVDYRNGNSDIYFKRTDYIAPPEVMPISPMNNVETGVLRPTFEWDINDTDTLSGIAYYQLEISDSVTFDTIIISDTIPEGNDKFTLTQDLIAGETYYWRVRTVDIAGNINKGINYRVLRIAGKPEKLWYVSAANGNDTYVGSETYPFATITRALQSAVAYDTIYIAAGTYSETVAIDTDGISLIGADSMATIIDPVGDSSVSMLNGISAQNVSGIVIKNLKIYDCYIGVYLNNVNNAIVEDMTISYCGKNLSPWIGGGIYIGVNSYGNNVRNSKIEYSWTGITIDSGCQNNVSNNQIDTIISYGISLNTYSNQNIIDNNICIFSGGLNLSGATDNTIINNQFLYGTSYGMNISNNSNYN